MAYVAWDFLAVDLTVLGTGSVNLYVLGEDMEPIAGPYARSSGSGLFTYDDTPSYGFRVAHTDPGIAGPLAFGVKEVTLSTTDGLTYTILTVRQARPQLSEAYNLLPDTGTPSTWLHVENQDAFNAGTTMAVAGMTCVTGYLTDFLNATYTATYSTTDYAITGEPGRAGVSWSSGDERRVPNGDVVIMFGAPAPPRTRPIGGNARLRQRQTPFITR